MIFILGQFDLWLYGIYVSVLSVILW